MKTAITVLAALGLAAGLAATASAAEYPAKKVEIYIPAAPGGTTDTIGRVFAQYLEKKGGANVVIINQTGGGGVVAEQAVKDGPTDGSRLLLFHAMMHVANLLKRSPMGYQDFTSLAVLSSSNDCYVAHASAPFSTLPELFKYAEANKVTIASQLGGTTQIKGQALVKAAGGKIRVVDAGAESQRVTALLGKQVDISIMGVNSASQYLKAGDVKVLAVMNKAPDPFEPKWPTAASQGVDIHFPNLQILFGPKGLSADLVTRIDAVFTEIGNDPAFKADVEKAKQSAVFMNAAQTAVQVEEDHKFVKAMID